MFLVGYIVLVCLFLTYSGKLDFNILRLLEAYIFLSLALLLLQIRLKSFSALGLVVAQPVAGILVYVTLFNPVYFSLFHPTMTELALILGGVAGVLWLGGGAFMIFIVFADDNPFADYDENILEKSGRELAFRCSYAQIIKSHKKLFYFQHLECWSSKEYQKRFFDEGDFSG